MEPDSSTDQRPVIQASEILGKIERGKDVEYDGVVVEGDLDLSGLELPTEHVDRSISEITFGVASEIKTVCSKIIITNSEFRGDINFGDTIFKASISFKGSGFNLAANFSGTEFVRNANYQGSIFSDDANFNGAQFGVGVDFNRAIFKGGANFNVTGFRYFANFKECKFLGGDANFNGANFSGDTDFSKVLFLGNTNFTAAKFTCEYVSFNKAGFMGDADFMQAFFDNVDAYFKETRFMGESNFFRVTFSCENVDFSGSDFQGLTDSDLENFQSVRYLSFKDAKFYNPKTQELTCRIAKRKMEDLGNKKEADYYFYKELEAIRIKNGIRGIEQEKILRPSNIKELVSLFRLKITQTKIKIKRALIYDVLEYIFIQRIFGYGVRPFNVAKAWLIVVLTLGFVYLIGSGVEKTNNTLEWYEYFYFSIVTAATPGYAGYTPASGLYTLIAGAEAIFGTFMWAAFIATFARKWQR